MKNGKVHGLILAVFMLLFLCFGLTVSAAEVPVESAATATAADTAIGTKALAAAIVVATASAAGAVAMGMAIARCVESIARQPEAASKINAAMLLGLVFVETLIIYALIVAILIIFVL